jgi:ComF family protein
MVGGWLSKVMAESGRVCAASILVRCELTTPPMFKRLLSHAASALPSQCAVCRAWGRERVCSACTVRFSPTEARCQTCALPLAGSALRCGTCLHHGSLLDACYAAVDYGYPWDSLLAQLKFAGGTGAGNASGPDPAMARAIAGVMRQHKALMQALAQADWAVPVPLSQARLRQRGFNQALEITRHLLAPATGPVRVRVQLHPRLLVRTRDTASQVGLDRAERLRNMQHAFALEPSCAAQAAGAHIVLVDDVTTTTATLGAAAAALRSAGAASVVGIVFARTPLPD